MKYRVVAQEFRSKIGDIEGVPYWVRGWRNGEIWAGTRSSLDLDKLKNRLDEIGIKYTVDKYVLILHYESE